MRRRGSREPERSGERLMRTKRMPPSYFGAAIAIMVALHFVLPIVQLFHGVWRLSGLLPLAIGAWLNASGSRLFDGAGTTIKPFQRPSTLVAHGPFRFSRNPMYLGMTLALLGIGLLLGSLAPVFVVPAFMLVMQAQFIVQEEADMLERFGDDYVEYSRRVRRWL